MVPRIALLALLVATEAAVVRVPRDIEPMNAYSSKEVNGTTEYFDEQERMELKQCNELLLAEWKRSTNLNIPDVEEHFFEDKLPSLEHDNDEVEKDIQGQTNNDLDVKKQVMNHTADQDLLEQEVAAMTKIFATARICPYTNQQCDIRTEGIRLTPDMEKIMSESRDYDELKYVWSQWRDASGAKMRSNYKTYVNQGNVEAVHHGFADMGERWRNVFETPGFQEEIQRLWQMVKPLYSRLHSYALKKLRVFYKSEIPDGHLIPAHILGSMWGETWYNIYGILEPFPNATKVDITQAMLDQGYDVRRMFEVANEFYTSMGLEPMEMAYGDLAIIEQPDDRDIVCHASAWDFCDGKDYRIRMCATVKEEDFLTIHHELGHIQYFILYKEQPYSFMNGANPGFEEAIGDVISLSVNNPQHYRTIGLLNEYTDSYENTINSLLRTALDKIAFLPLGILIDTWRWEVFSGETKESDWNKRWWELRESLQMVSAPVERTENHFDPGAKYHITSDHQYISYFVAYILQFQIYRSLCIEAGQYDPENAMAKPLHTCDFYRSTKAGKKLRDGLKLGSSQHWKIVLHELTGENELSASALLEYFKPLSDFLESEDESVDHSALIALSILGTVFVVAFGC